MTSHFVRDGNTEWEVVGDLIASSSSKADWKSRWVEFELYRTPTGSYVIARIGQSLIFHQKSCKLVTRNNLKPVQEGTAPPNAVPCIDCSPVRAVLDDVYLETPRYFALKTTTAKGVLAAVMQCDDNNSEYLTNVAKRLLIQAAEADEEIRNVFTRRVIE